MTKLGKRNEERIVVYADGLCEPCNPGGVACYGFVIKTGQEVLVRGKGVVCEGRGATNNVAEYSAAQAALDWLIEQGLTKEQIEVCSDSQLLIRQMTGEYQVSSERIIPLYNRLERTSARFKRLRWTWVPREKNQEADLLSREAYYEHISRKKARGLKVEMDDDGDCASSQAKVLNGMLLISKTGLAVARWRRREELSRANT